MDRLPQALRIVHVRPGIDGLLDLGDNAGNGGYCLVSSIAERLRVLRDVVLEREGLVMEVFGRTRRTEGLGQAARPGRYLVNAGIDDAPADVRAYSGGLLQAIIHGRLKGNAVRRRIDDRRPEHDDVIFRHNNFPLRKGAFVSLLPAGRG